MNSHLTRLSFRPDFSTPAKRGAGSPFGTVKVLRHGEERCRFGAFASEPAAKRFPRDIRSFPMTQPDDVDECALRRVNADRTLVADD